MIHSKVHPEATKLVNNYIDELPEWSKAICSKLRQIILSGCSQIQEKLKDNY